MDDMSKTGPGPGVGCGGRMSRRRKRDAVLRLSGGGDMELLFPSLGARRRPSEWRYGFPAAGEAALATR